MRLSRALAYGRIQAVLLHAPGQDEPPQEQNDDGIKIGLEDLLSSKPGHNDQEKGRDERGDVQGNHLGDPENHSYRYDGQHHPLAGLQDG